VTRNLIVQCLSDLWAPTLPMVDSELDAIVTTRSPSLTVANDFPYHHPECCRAAPVESSKSDGGAALNRSEMDPPIIFMKLAPCLRISRVAATTFRRVMIKVGKVSLRSAFNLASVRRHAIC
jgi:hypothetical protein